MQSTGRLGQLSPGTSGVNLHQVLRIVQTVINGMYIFGPFSQKGTNNGKDILKI